MIKKLKRYTKVIAPKIIGRIKKSTQKIYSYILFIIDFKNFKRNSKDDKRFEMKWKNRYPCLDDRTKQTSFDRHYIYHIAWATRKVRKINPEFHVDISSSLYFSSILSTFIPVRFYDYRPADIKLSGLISEHADLTSLHFKSNSIKSLSCMHTVEHVGLGRYGDPIDTEGDLKAIKELKRVLSKGGNLLFVVPIGKPKIVFNAHRIYSKEQILKYFSDLKLKEFVLIPDDALDGGLVNDPSSKLLKKQNYACGCFWFRK